MKLALLVLLTGTALAAPFWVLDDNLPRAEVKALGCSGKRFQTAQSHVYEYAGETLNTIEGSTERTTGLKLTAKVVITTMSECKYMMQLRSVELLSKSMSQDKFITNADSAKLKSELEKYQLGFSMIDNKISTLHTNENEPTHVLNLKRGILSTLQVDEATTEETDVNGKCIAEFTRENGQVVKMKRLSDCMDRAQNEIGFQSSTITSASNLKPLDSTSKCVYDIKNDVIQSVLCNEIHLFKPFSAGYKTPSGAMTTVKQTMELLKKSNDITVGAVPSDFDKMTTLSYEHTNDERKPSVTINKQVDKVMSLLVDQNELSAKQSSANEFTSLVTLLRKMDKKEMERIWDKYYDCMKSGFCTEANIRDLYRQYLLDAVAYCGTSTCISMVHKVILDGQVSGERMNMFLQSITLVGKTTEKMIADVLSICKKKPSRQAYLALGTLMSRHCLQNPEECNTNIKNSIKMAEEHLAEKLGQSCEGQKDNDRVEELLRVLKAIGNAKRPVTVRDTLIRCAEKAEHANITSSIFDALRGFACDSKDQLMQVLDNKNNNEETRIHAFMTMMKCPSKEVLISAINALEKEDNNQVASFIWSYLRNVMESSDPDHKTTQELLTKITTDKPLREVNLPMHQFSKAFEQSLHSEFLKSGITSQAHIIFNKDKFLPHMGMFNMKANVMGHPIEMLETKVGVDGIENVLETLVGPNGMIPKDFSIDLGKYGKFNSEFLKKMIQKKNNMKKTFNDNLTKMHRRANKQFVEPNAHISLKIMGQEVRMLSYDDFLWMIDQIDNMNVVQLLKNYANGGHKTFSKSLMFLEMTHTVPTGLGLPLKLKLTGSSVTTIDLKGKFDIRNLFWGTPGMNINGYVKPSTVLELSGKMGIESNFVSSGMFVNSSMFMSQIIKGGIEYKHGKLLKINMDTPEEPLARMNFSTTPYLFMDEEKELVEGTERKISPDHCVKSAILGFGVCTNMRMPFAFREYEAPYFPLSGPAYFGWKLIRGDEKLTTWQFLIKFTKRQQKTFGVIEFSTPRATYERRVGGNLILTDGETKSLMLSVGKEKKASVEFSYHTVTHRTSIISKTNVFSTKEVMTKLTYFNQTTGMDREYGILYSAEYDWYKFEHVTKFVRKPSGYMFKTTTQYYPEKSLVGTIEYDTEEKKLTAGVNINELKKAFELSGQFKQNGEEKGIEILGKCLSSGKTITIYSGYQNTDDVKQLLFSADVLGYSAKEVLGYYKKKGLHSLSYFLSVNGKIININGDLLSSADIKTLDLTADFFGKKAFSTFTLKNTDAEKSIAVNGDAMGKDAQVKLGYYDESNTKELKIDYKVLGKKGAILARYDVKQGSARTTIAAFHDKYNIGMRGVFTRNHGHGNSVCSSMFYGVGPKERTPFLLCFNYHSLGTSYIHKRLTTTLEVAESKKGELIFNFEKHTGHVKLASHIKYNGKNLGKIINSLKYSSDMNNELRLVFESGKYTAGYKLFSASSSKGTNIGVQANVMDKSISFLHKYTTEKAQGLKEMKVTSELYINNQIVPVTTDVIFLHGNGVSGPTFKLNIGKHTVGYSIMVSYNGVYGLESEFVLMKEVEVLFKLSQETVLLTQKSKTLKQTLKIGVNGKQYNYGWDMTYENRGNDNKMAHALVLGLQYSTKRKSSVEFILSNNKKQVALNVNVEYIPTKTLKHFIAYSKNAKKLEVSVEFLPKMFYSFITKLSKRKAYSLESEMALKWKKYRRSLKMINTYLNNNKKFELTTGFGKDMTFSFTMMKSNPKSIILGASVFEQTAKIVGVYKKSSAQLRVVVNKKMLINFGTSYDKLTGNIKLTMADSKKTFFKIMKSYNKYKNQYSLQMLGAKEWMEVTTKYNKRNNVGKVGLSVLGKEYITFSAIKEGTSVSLKVEALPLKESVIITGSLNKPEKSVTLSAKYGKVNVGYTLRTDWKNLILSETLFINKRSIEMKVYMEQNSLNIKFELTPTSIAQLVFEVQDDRILKATLQRSQGSRLVNETSFKYKLSKNMCQFAFNWNAETISKISKMAGKQFADVKEKMEPLFNKATLEAKKFTKKAYMESEKFFEESAKDISEATFNFVNNLDKTFDEFDFVAAKDNLGELSLTSLKKLSEIIQETLKAMIQGLKSVKKNVPKLLQQYKKLKINARGLPVKVTEKMTEILSQLQNDLDKNWNDIATLTFKLANNITESSKPVVNKALTLIQDFKIQGKPLKEIIVLAKNSLNKYYEIYSKTGFVRFEELKTEGAKIYNEGTKYLLKMKMPYRDETIEEVIEIVTNKAMELKDQVSDIDLQKNFEELKVQIFKYKLNGKTIVQHFKLLQKDLMNLPEATKAKILTFIKNIRVMGKKIDSALKKMDKFTKPLQKYVVVVGKSAKKHFKPIMKKSWSKLISQIKSMELTSIRPVIMSKLQMIEEFILPLIEPLVPLYNNLKFQINNFKINGFTIGPLMQFYKDIAVQAVSTNMQKAKSILDEQVKTMTKYSELLSKMTPEEMVDYAFDKSSKLATEAIGYSKEMYQQRQKMLDKLVESMKQLYQEFNKQYEQMRSMTVEQVLDDLMYKSSKNIVSTAEELSKIIRQIAKLEISKPVIVAWKQAKVMKHLKKAGVNQKMFDMIKAAKDVNITQVAAKTSTMIQDFLSDLYGQIFIKAVMFYGKLESVYDYVRSIPKKEYDQWFNELKDFTMTNKDKMMKVTKKMMNMMEKAYKNSQIKSKKLYGASLELYSAMQKMSESNYQEFMKEYVTPAQEYYSLLAQKSKLFYEDIEQPSIDVTNHYKTIAQNFALENYKIVEKLASEYYKLYSEMLNGKIEEMNQLMMKKYNDFLNEYGDMTWEEIYAKTSKYGKKQYKQVKKNILKTQKKLEKEFAKLNKKAVKLYKDAIGKYEEYLKYIETKLTPQGLEMYKKYKMIIESFLRDVEKTTGKVMSDIKSKAMKIYNDNKHKTLNVIYNEIKAVIMVQIRKQYALAKKFTDNKITEFKKMSVNYYNKGYVLMTNVIIPEIKLEGESLINQTLRSSVLLGKEAVKAFKPHYTIIKETVKQMSTLLKTKGMKLFGKTNEMFKNYVEKLVALLEELLMKVQNYELYNELINHEYVSKMTLKIEELKKMMKEKIEMLKGKIEDLKKHPKTIEYQKKVEEQIETLKVQINIYKSQVNKYYEHQNVEKALKTLKKFRKSALFTYGKVSNDVEEIVEGFEMMASELRKFGEQMVEKFLDQPEKTFWEAIADTKQFADSTYIFLKEVLTEENIKQIAKYIPIIAKKQYAYVVKNYFDNWARTTAKKLYKDAEKQLNEIKLKAQRTWKMLPGELNTMMKKTYKEIKTEMKMLYKKQKLSLTSHWKACPFRIVVQNPIWEEIAEEILNHEIVDAIKYLTSLTTEQAMQIKKILDAEYTIKKEILIQKFNELKGDINFKLDELKTEVKGQYENVVKVVTKKYKETVENIEQVYAKVEKFVNEVTIAEMVATINQKYEETMLKMEEMKNNLIMMKEKYEIKAKKMYNKYEKEVKKMYSKYEVEAKQIYGEYKQKAIAFYKKYEKKLKPMYKKYEEEAMKIYNKYLPIVLEKYEEILEQVNAKYVELEKQYYALYEKYYGKSMLLIKDAKKEVTKSWKQSKLRSKLIIFTKMSIRETIAALKKLPKDTETLILSTKDLAVSTYNKYYEQVSAEFLAKYKNVLAELSKQHEELINLIEPYTVPIVVAYKWVENEVVETAIFVYKYHDIAGKYNSARTFATSEYKRLRPIVESNLKKYIESGKTYALEKFETYKAEAEVMAKEYKKKAIDIAEEYTDKAKKYSLIAGDKTLRGIHTTLRYIDNFDLNSMGKDLSNKVTNQARSLYTEFTKYVSIDLSNGEILITIPHGDVTPSFSKQYENLKLRARRSIKTIEGKGNELMEKLNERIEELKEKVMVLQGQLMDKIKENTKEVRADIMSSIEVNQRVIERVSFKANILYKKAYNKASREYKLLKLKSKLYTKKAKELVQNYYKKASVALEKVLRIANNIFMDLSNTPYTKLYGKIKGYSTKYYGMMKTKSVALYKQYNPIIKSKVESYMLEIEKASMTFYNDLLPYTTAVKSVYESVKSGDSLKAALRPLYTQFYFLVKYYEDELDKSYRKMKIQLCKEDPKLCKALRYSAKYHSFVFNKYGQRLTDLVVAGMDKYTESIVEGQRFVRKLKNMLQRPKSTYQATAMVFGDNYMTFDGKLHKFEIPSAKCQYILVHDFQNADFTILKTKDAIKIKNKDMKIVLFTNGKAITTLANNKIVKGLPVQYESSTCIRKENFVFCDFANDKFQVVMDLKHDIMTIGVSQWHHGKLQGLLGTNNRESFDDMRMPNGNLANNEVQFTNSYEMTGHGKCKLTSIKPKRKCGSQSNQCEQLFASPESEFGPFLNKIHSETFLEACKKDMSECGKTTKPKYCLAAHGFVQMLRAKGYQVEHLSECMTSGSRTIGQDWRQKAASKAVDVVVLISQRKGTNKRGIAQVLQKLQGILKAKNYNSRYALIGFGGAGIHEEAHVHALSGASTVFGNLASLKKEITLHMPFKGEGQVSNDAYHAILAASAQSFRPAAHKVFVMFNSEPHSSHKYGASITEALYALKNEAEASLFVFDEFNFKTLNKKGITLGQTNSKIYTTKNLKGLRLSNMELPSSEFKELVRESNGGMFTSNINNPNSFAKILYDAMSDAALKNPLKCLNCKLVKTWNGIPKQVCKSATC